MNLREQAVRGVVWSAAQTWGARVTTTLVFIILARLLDPADIGLVALAMLFIGFFSLFSEHGFAHALVQRDELEPEHLDSALWFGLGVGVALFAITQLAAGPIAALLGEPRIEPLLRWLALNFVVGGAKSAPVAVLKRQLRFKPLAVRTLVATVTGGVAGVAAALAGLGAWALVVQNLTQALVSVIALWAASDWRPGLRFSTRHFGELWSFAVKVLGADMLQYSNHHVDDLLIGVFLGPVALGYYSVAYRILTLLTELFTRTISSVMLPTFARMQGDSGRLRNGLYTATRLCSFVAFPAFLGVAALAPELTVVAFGAQWAPAVPVMRVLALMGALHSILFFNGNVITAVGKPGYSLAIAGVNAVTNVIAFAAVLAAGWGILGVAVVLVVRNYLFSPLPLLVLRRLIALDLSRYVRQIGPAALASLAMAGAVVATTALLQSAFDERLRLAAGTTVGVLTYGLLILGLGPHLPREALSYVRLLRRQA